VSQDGWAHMPAAQPRECGICGRKVRITAEAVWFDTFRLVTLHIACMPRKAA
jgi:hypothetical protein